MRKRLRPLARRVRRRLRRLRSVPAGPRTSAVVWPRPGVTAVVEADVPGATSDTVTVEIAVSVVSPGTERARFLALDNARVTFPHSPGYLAAGRVGGRTVAVRFAPHRRMVTVPHADIREVPDGVDLTAAAAWWLGVTALHGLVVAGDPPAGSIAVVGSGLVGVLARRLAAARGATRVVAVAASDAKRWTADAEPSTEFVVVGGDDALPELDVEVVVDATGTADGLPLAVALAPPGATVVLLGSPRVAEAPLPVRAIRDKGLRLVGAHVETMRLVAERTGVDPEPALSDEWFEHLRSGRVSLDDVLRERFHPDQAPVLYRRLASDRHLVGAAFDWDAPPRATAPPAAVPLLRSEVPVVRFGLLGCGDIGVQNAAAVAGATGASLTACFDPVERLAAEVADAHGAAVAPTFEALLERRDVDVVFVATPHDLHEPHSLAAMDAGKHLVVEKPLAADLPAAARIAAAARAAPTLVSVCLPMREDVRVRTARRAIAEGYVGPAHGALSTYLADKPPSYYFGGFSSRSPSTWRLSRARSGGGVLIMNLLHHVDLVRYLLDREATTVWASTVAAETGGEIEDVASVVVELDGAIATFVGGSHVVRGPGETLRLWGDAGQVEILPRLDVRSLVATAFAAADTPLEDDEGGRRVRFVERLVSGLAAGERPGPTADDGLAIQAIVSAAYRSAADGVAVRPADLVAEALR